jgi:Ca2+-binding RTX toxin-like protein
VKSTKLTNNSSRGLIFIDSAVDNLNSLISHVVSDTDVIVLHPAENGVDQITTALSSYSQLESLHIVAHGAPGHLRLGNSSLNLDSLADYRQVLQQWQAALAPQANLLLYGCQVAAGDRGQAFLNRLKEYIGVEVAASSTPVGNAAQGGNWQLDVQTGPISAPLAFEKEAIAAYPAILVDTFINEDFSDASGSTPPPGWTEDVITGDPKVDQWRFDNPGSRSLPDFLTNPAAIFDSDFLSNNDLPENVALVSPVFDASKETQVFLELKQQYLGLIDPDYGSEGFIEVYNGQTWQPVADQVQDVVGTTRIDISKQAAGVANAQVRFRWTGNWSYYWALDDVKVVDALTPGITVSGNPQVSEDNVPDTRNFKFVLDSKPTSNVTISFVADSKQLQPIQSLTFTPDNWNVGQTATVRAVADGIAEGENQTSPIQIKVTSADPIYSGFKVPDAIATITDHTIPGFPSYRTVEKTYADLGAIATNNSDIADWIDIGDSYDKATPGGPAGYDIYALQLTNKDKPPAVGKKPVLYVEASIHAREYSTAEVASRFAEALAATYGIDADTTWLLDYFQIDIVPVVNPDGRKFAEQGYLWRKNTNPNPPPGAEPADFPNYGVDLNRNHDFEWGEVEGGSSGDPSSETYRGASPASEPETKAVENFVKTLFPDQRGPNKTDAAPADATGVFVDLHSFGNTVLYPWGSTSQPAPNKDALRTLGLKFGYYTDSNGTPYDTYQAIGLYPTDGTTDDWAYGTLGVAGYTWEIGTAFFESSDYFEKSIAPQVIPALFYAAKSAYRPYQTPFGPESVDVALNQGQVVAGTGPVILTATADGTRYADSNADGLKEGTELPKPKVVTGARYSIDAPSWIPGTKLYDLPAADGKFNKPVENLRATIDTTGLTPGRHTIFVESKNTDGDWGVPSAVFLDVLPAASATKITKGSNRDDTILGDKRADDIIYALGGGDRVNARSGNDIVVAGNGGDRVNGGSGDDLIYGGAGDDYLDGGVGNDKIYGEAGRDRLIGYNGDDLLWGGKGDDSLQGGKGQDTFVVAFNEGTDTFQDFKIGEDLIGLAGRLNFSQLSISQSGRFTLITFDNNVLARLDNVTATALTATSFVAV